MAVPESHPMARWRSESDCDCPDTRDPQFHITKADAKAREYEHSHDIDIDELDEVVG